MSRTRRRRKGKYRGKNCSNTQDPNARWRCHRHAIRRARKHHQLNLSSEDLNVVARRILDEKDFISRERQGKGRFKYTMTIGPSYKQKTVNLIFDHTINCVVTILKD